jgi:hypothetical protein
VEGKVHSIWRPHRRPLAACKETLEDEDILSLLDELHGMARDRGLDLSLLPPYPSKMRNPASDECVTLSAMPRASRPGSTLDLLTGKGE